MARTSTLYAAVAAGSALGAVARQVCTIGLMVALGPAFPWGTLAVNVIGSLLIGWYAARLENHALPVTARDIRRQFIMTGFCGGFTTFSIFSLETIKLVEDGGPALAGLYVAVSVPLWLAGVCIGYGVANRSVRPDIR